MRGLAFRVYQARLLRLRVDALYVSFVNPPNDFCLWLYDFHPTPVTGGHPQTLSLNLNLNNGVRT